MSTVDTDPVLHPDKQLGFKHATNRPDLQHNIFLLKVVDKLGLAPPNDPAAKVGRVLDVRTGIWAIDYTDEHPEAETCPLASNITSGFY
ncbi:hypothetical protein LB505_013022 [Fusarium chuoi]|nr:hypothetical protein LB505_013022 [Fusarium chuoi]